MTPTSPISDDTSVPISRVDERIAPKELLDAGKAVKLAELSQYRFFSPALLYIFGRFWDEPLCQFLAEYNAVCRFRHWRFVQPIFRGMTTPDGNEDWNYVLWAVEQEAFEPLERFLLSLAFVDPADNSVIRIGSQDVLLVDPLFADQRKISTDIPLTSIVVLGVDASWGAVAVEAMSPVAAMIAGGQPVKLFLPQKHTLEFAKKLAFGNNPNHALEPLQHIQPVQPTGGPLDQQQVLQAIEAYRKDSQ